MESVFESIRRVLRLALSMHRPFACCLLMLLAGVMASCQDTSESFAPSPSNGAGPPLGSPAEGTLSIGVLGDSNSDEYRADDNRGGIYSSVTFNWVEILAELRSIPFGPWGTRDEPRRTGYAYNWARSGARAADLKVQQAGLAQQVREGLVTHVIINIGINDFHPNATSYRAIYDGALTGRQLDEHLDGVTADIRSAVDEVLSAGARVLVTGVPDAGLYPLYHDVYPDPQRRRVVSEAIGSINSKLQADAVGRQNLAYSAPEAMFEAMLERADGQGNILVGGEAINTMQRGNSPHHLQLDDFSQHGGTVANGLVANHVFLQPLNDAFGTAIPLLLDEEILCMAGINTATNCAVSVPASPRPPILTIETS